MSTRATPLVLAILSNAAWAQAQPGGDGPSAATLEAVVVTARYREESLQRVPISISAITGDAIASGQVTTLQGLEFSVPNLVFGETGASAETFIGIRGIGDFSRNIGFDTRVGVYVDGVFAGQSLAVDQGLIDVQQVEVLRGPQGTLFGKNSSSGVIQIVSRRPVPGETSGEWRLRGGNLGTLGGSGTLNVPLGASAAARIAVVAQQQDGYIDNLYDGGQLMSNDHVFGRVRLLAQPSEALELDFTVDFRRQDNDTLFLEPDASYELAAGNPAAVLPFVVDQDAPLIDENSGWGAGLRLNYTLPAGFVLTSIAGYRSVDRRTGSDEDATRAFALHARYFEDDFNHFTGELRLASPGDARFRYVLGAFWFDQDARTDRIAALGPAWGGPAQGVDAATQHSRVDSRSWAAFANANYDLSERLTASAGLRYTEEDKDAVIYQVVFPGFGLAQLIDQSMSRSEGYATATANLQYQFNDDVSGYFTYASGYKGGGFNVDLVADAADLPFEEETVDSFEVGLKSSLLGGRLRLNLAAFHAEYDDYQVFQFRFNPASSTTTLLISNAAAVTTEGFELEGTALLGEGFSLDFGLGYNDAQFDDFPGGAIDGTTGLPLNVAGNQLPRAPEWTANLGGTWRFALGSAPTRLMVGYSYRSEQFFNPDNRENSRQGAYGLWSAALDCELGEHWSFSLYGRNLADEEYRTMRGISFLGVPFGLHGQPRTYGAEISFRH
jgi:iron complex outermembrane receptor protein